MILGVDPGTKRVGLALADLETRFARPVETVDADAARERIPQLVADSGVTTVVIGRPLSLSGGEGPAVDAYRGFVSEVRSALPAGVDVVEYDERLTSIVARRRLQDAGLDAKKARPLIDAVAAQVMLQGYIDSQVRRS